MQEKQEILDYNMINKSDNCVGVADLDNSFSGKCSSSVNSKYI